MVYKISIGIEHKYDFAIVLIFNVKFSLLDNTADNIKGIGKNNNPENLLLMVAHLIDLSSI